MVKLDAEHIETALTCANPACVRCGHCLTCVMLTAWFIQADEALSA